MQNPPDSLNEREFELINIIGAQLAASQRDLSKQLDISLGMTNLLIRRMVGKGYIRIRQLNKKKTQYILTPKGFTEKYRKSVNYTLKTIHSIGLIRTQLDIIIRRLYDVGERVFFVYGNSDLTELVEMSLNHPHWGGVQFSRVDKLFEHPEGIFLICREQAQIPSSGIRSVDLIKELVTQADIGFKGE